MPVGANRCRDKEKNVASSSYAHTPGIVFTERGYTRFAIVFVGCCIREATDPTYTPRGSAVTYDTAWIGLYPLDHCGHARSRQWRACDTCDASIYR